MDVLLYGSEFMRTARRAVKMIATKIIEGILAKELIVTFDYEEEKISLFLHNLEDNRLVLSVHRDGEQAYMIYGFNTLESIKDMANDIFYVLTLPVIDIKL